MLRKRFSCRRAAVNEVMRWLNKAEKRNRVYDIAHDLDIYTPINPVSYNASVAKEFDITPDSYNSQEMLNAYMKFIIFIPFLLPTLFVTFFFLNGINILFFTQL